MHERTRVRTHANTRHIHTHTRARVHTVMFAFLCGSRQLIETQDEMSEMKNKVRVLEHQSQQLKEEVAAREAAVVKEHLEVIRLEKERDSLLSEIQMLKQQLRDHGQVWRRPMNTVITVAKAYRTLAAIQDTEANVGAKRQRRQSGQILACVRRQK